MTDKIWRDWPYLAGDGVLHMLADLFARLVSRLERNVEVWDLASAIGSPAVASEGNSAVITWNTGWTMKITKEGDRYIKAAYGKGQSLTATPANTSDAEKAK